MAWKAVITAWDLDAPSVTYSYYDDADPVNTPNPSTFLYTEVFSRADIGSDADLQAAVIQTGKAKRKVYNRIQAVKQTGPVAIS